MPDIVVTEFMGEGALDAFGNDYDVVYDPSLVDNPDKMLALLGDCRAVIVRNRTQVRAELLAAAPKLEAVGRLGVGLDNIDLPACEAKGVAVLPATGANAQCVAEYVLAGLLMLLRGGAYHAKHPMMAGNWPRNDLQNGREIRGSQLGLIGFGGIARLVASMVQPLGMIVTAYDPFVSSDDPIWAKTGVKPLSLNDLLSDSDAVSLHVPLTDETQHLIGDSNLDLMKLDAILINTARGGVVNEEALADALTGERLGGAMLDVFEEEPLTDGTKFKGVPNLILTPHIAGLTQEGNDRVSTVTVENIKRILEKK
jgi:(S)-sulfolactate dehydrogenase